MTTEQPFQISNNVVLLERYEGVANLLSAFGAATPSRLILQGSISSLLPEIFKGGFGRLGWGFGPILDSSVKLDGEQLKKMCSRRKQESQDSSGWEFHPIIFSDAFSLMQRKVKTTVAKNSPIERGLPNKA